jgi:hypothetical protein
MAPYTENDKLLFPSYFLFIFFLYFYDGAESVSGGSYSKQTIPPLLLHSHFGICAAFKWKLTLYTMDDAPTSFLLNVTQQSPRLKQRT